jgi:hypothetical protein
MRAGSAAIVGELGEKRRLLSAISREGRTRLSGVECTEIWDGTIPTALMRGVGNTGRIDRVTQSRDKMSAAGRHLQVVGTQQASRVCAVA